MIESFTQFAIEAFNHLRMFLSALYEIVTKDLFSMIASLVIPSLVVFIVITMLDDPPHH